MTVLVVTETIRIYEIVVYIILSVASQQSNLGRNVS